VDRQQTFRIMSDIAREYWNVSFSPNIFTPYPGIPIWPQLKEMGLKEPQSLEEWETLALGFNVLPWLQGEELRRLRRSLECLVLNNQIRKATKKSVWLRQGFRRALARLYAGASARTAIHFLGNSGSLGLSSMSRQGDRSSL
jgi:anaerobic magnesium-protoporphyrin IX monomethyl ester cyclase